MIKLFTHIDLDGVGCAVLSKLTFKDNVDISYCNYDEINEEVLDYIKTNDEDEIHITDISVNEDVAKLLNERGNVYLFDHHATALNLNKYDWADVRVDILGVKTSGTALYRFWLLKNDYLKNNPILKSFTDVVTVYDTWRWVDLPDGYIYKQVNDLLYIYGRDKFIDWCLDQLNTNTFPLLKREDKLVLEIKQKEINDYIDQKDKEIFICNMNADKEYAMGVVFADKYTSELGNKLCERHPEIDFVAIINMDGTVSYRTVKDIDLGQNIAKKLGGGGHAKAAGNTFNKDNLRSLVIEYLFS